MATPKSTSLNYAKLRNQKRNNSNVDIDKDLGNLYRNQDTQQASSQIRVQQVDNTNFLQEKKTNQINYNQNGQIVNSQQEPQQNQIGNNKGIHNQASAGQGNQNQQQPVQSLKQQQQQSFQLNQKNIQEFQYKQNSTQQYDNQNQNIQLKPELNVIQNDSKQDNQNSFQAQNQSQQLQQQIQNQEKKSQPSDAAYQSNQDYIDQMIKQKKHVEDPTKLKQKNVIGKTPIPPFMKNFHQMQQMQQQQELIMKQQKTKQQLKSSQSQQYQQQNSNDTVRLNQNSSVNSQAKNVAEKQQEDESIQIENNSQQVNEQQTNQDDKLTQRKTLGNSQPKLFDQFFRNNSYQGTLSSNSQPSHQIQVAQTQRNNNTHQEKIQNISVLSNQSDLKNSNNTSQVLTQPAQSQQIFHSNHFNTSPSHSNEQQLINNSSSNQHQNHHLSSINRDNPITSKRQSHTQIHQHQSQQSQTQNHQKKESSLFNSQSSTILNNSLGNISPTAQFNNLDSSQFNISNISNIQNLSHNVSSINNQSNIMINYNSNNVMNNSNMNSTMSFQKQFEEQLPYNENNQGKEEAQNSDFLNSLNIYIDYFNSALQEGEKSVKISQQSNTNLELFKENQRLKQQLEQLEEKLKETETSRKILINDLSKLKNKDSEYKKKIQQLAKENSETKTLLLSTNYKLHHTKEQYAKEKIEHENTKFTLKKALLARSNNLENSNLLNKADNNITQQKNQTQKKSFLQQYNIQENRSLQNNQKFGINNQAISQQYQRPYQNSYKILNDPHNNYINGKQYQNSVPQLYSNSNDPPSLSSLVVNQQQVYDGEQTAISRIVDQDLKMVDPIYVNQGQPQNFSNQINLQQNIQELPLIAERFNGPAFGGGLHNIQQNEFDELECKDFNLDDSNQNLDVSGPDIYQDNHNMIVRDDLTDNTTDIINLNQPSPSIHIQSGIPAQTGGARVNSMHQQKYQNNCIHLFETNQQLTSNNQLGYKQQASNVMQEDDYEQDGEDMDLSDNFNLDTDNQINEDNSAINIENQNKGQLEALTLPIQSDLDLGQDGQNQYYDYQSNKIFNTYDNSNFKYSTHRDHIDQNTKGIGQLAATSCSYKKGVGSLDEDHVYQMMKLQYHPTYEMNKQNQNLKMANNIISQQNQQNLKSQLKKQQIYHNRNQQGGRTMSMSYQKPQFSSQQIQMFQMMQNQKQKINMQQQQQQQIYQQQQQLQPFANYL
ncbi:kinase domain protein (macronuclear) [Tetrahymena thermophila SB210]|uniref:Kinase domain protein n=1 Tax=Tetrahymena thermophila (strain SB210) TaxID=312017 RepID=W7XKQ3_TETTS|nr:kinase domain protein [Tetrahymena thermophila SB210]EWS75114.1 kinase domain protein [Tetrahymena thermophila SB210]|eukprot:XP_012652352.1 kinase domain protein [Tetrahymena thermophila SB210]